MSGDALRDELAVQTGLERTLRERLYSVQSSGLRARASAAIAAAAATRTHQLIDAVPERHNATSEAWRARLDDVWAYLGGDESRHRDLSEAIAGFLVSPLNHTDGQDGPDDFDRPQTIASFSAAASVVLWGVDFATTAVNQLFEAIDLMVDQEMTTDRRVVVEREHDWALQMIEAVIGAASQTGSGQFPDGFIERLRSTSAA